MFKKYFQIKKISGCTDVYFIFKHQDYFANRRVFFSTNNFAALNPVVTDYSNNSFVFNAAEVKKLKNFDFILSLSNQDDNFRETLLPIPYEYIFKTLTVEEKKIYESMKKENSDCIFQIFQACLKSE